MTSRQVRVGLVGCGEIASAVHARALARRRDATLAAVADPAAAARERAARLAPRAELYDDPLRLLDRRDIDAVVICAPSDLHAGLATLALEAGKHVYLEKPIATTGGDATRLLAAGLASTATAAVGFNRRFHPLFERARSLLQAGAIGRVLAASTIFCEPTPLAAMPEWKRHRASGGGVLLDLGSHHVDLMRWLLDDEIDVVGASVESSSSDHDSARMRLMTNGGVSIDGFFSFRAARADVVTLIGELGVLRFDRYAGSISLQVARGATCAVRRRRVLPSAAVAAWRVGRVVRPALEPSYARALAAFIRRLRGHQVELPTLTDGWRSLESVLAAEELAGREAVAHGR